jgi:hypothetical protein
MKFKVLTDADVAHLELSHDELLRVDGGLARLLAAPPAIDNRKCCRQCDCTGYRQGNPSTICGACGHDWQAHKC